MISLMIVSAMIINGAPCYGDKLIERLQFVIDNYIILYTFHNKRRCVIFTLQITLITEHKG